MKKIFLFLLISLAFYNLPAQKFEKKLDSLISVEFKEKDGPGLVFLVSKNGKAIYEKAIGKANLELNVDLKNENVFQIASMTKQFTAVAILILEEQGKLNVNETVSKYIPDYPNGDKITIHHLLTHTSGIKDFTKIKALKDISQKEMTPEMMVDFFKNEKVDFLPGEKFEYNNSGYVLLGYIIELVSKESYENFLKKNIFDKAGMKNTFYATDRQIVKNRAYGYHKKESGYVNKTVISYSIPFSSGALMSTSADLLKWQNALTQNKLLKKENLEKAFRKNHLNNGEEFSYGYGWHLKDIKGIPTREHGGHLFGFKSMAVYIPSKDIYAVTLSNCDCNSPTEITKKIAEIMLKNYSN
ncbi:serine hydrolase domain-containing protein [Cloacibacterium rupense]|uniref:serine hydrolase domain-containing protein n=1 Tax=Cloacibacterium rupense TaxID=517423 RepID=UPI00166F0265|nr:serine hydrolase domain-containing protein [Cloacibacterium rupense]